MQYFSYLRSILSTQQQKAALADRKTEWAILTPKMMRFAQIPGGVIHKEHITYRHPFDQTREFKRYSVI
jgi:hypothetical protein